MGNLQYQLSLKDLFRHIRHGTILRNCRTQSFLWSQAYDKCSTEVPVVQRFHLI